MVSLECFCPSPWSTALIARPDLLWSGDVGPHHVFIYTFSTPDAVNLSMHAQSQEHDSRIEYATNLEKVQEAKAMDFIG